MSSVSDVQPRLLRELLAEINRHDTRLPDFQRDFVWNVAAIKRLLGSVGSNFPIGSILRLSTKNGQAPFGWRLFNPYDNEPSKIDPTFKYMVLDGQQRLTSLLHAFYGLGEYLFYIDFKKLHNQYTASPDDIDFEECVIEVKKKQMNKFNYDQESVQKEMWLMPMTYLSTGGYYQWLGKVQPMLPQDYNEKFDNLCKILTDYPIPVVTLSSDITVDAICAIFESLNSSGKQLTPFELVNARIYGQSNMEIDLRKLVREAQQQYSFIASKEFSDYALLQIISLLLTYRLRQEFQINNSSHDSEKLPVVSCKKKDILNKITVADINRYWDDLLKASDFTINLLKHSCGLLDISYLPYKSILVPLIATVIQLRLHQQNGPSVSAIKDKLVKWYWNVVFAQVYETSTDTRGAKDFVELVDWIENNKSQPSNLYRDSIQQLILSDYDNPNSGIYKGIICLLIQRKAKDFYNGDSVDNLEMIDDHHVFPYAFLTKAYPASSDNQNQMERYYNCVLNRTLISRQTNNKIRAKKPSVYMSEIKSEHVGIVSRISNVFGDDRTKYHEILESHLLPYQDESCYLNDDYETFRKQRHDILMSEIKKVTGIQ